MNLLEQAKKRFLPKEPKVNKYIESMGKARTKDKIKNAAKPGKKSKTKDKMAAKSVKRVVSKATI